MRPTDTAAPPRDRLMATAMIVGPVLVLASTIAFLFEGGIGDGTTGGTIQVWGTATYGIAFVGLTRLVEPGAPRLAAFLLATGLVGAATGAAFGVDSMVYALDPAAAISEMDEAVYANLGLLLPGLLFPLTLVVAGVSLRRHEAVRQAAAIGLILGGLAFPVSRIGAIGPVAVASDLLLLGGMGAIGLDLLRGTALASARGRRVAVAG